MASFITSQDSLSFLSPHRIRNSIGYEPSQCLKAKGNSLSNDHRIIAFVIAVVFIASSSVFNHSAFMDARFAREMKKA